MTTEPGHSTLLAMLQQEMPLDVGPYRLRASGTKPALFIIDEAVGFCTPGAGQLAPRIGDPAVAAIDEMVRRTDSLARDFASIEGVPDLGVPRPAPSGCARTPLSASLHHRYR